MGISALGAGCSQLQSVGLIGCHMVTDECLMSLCIRNQFMTCRRGDGPIHLGMT